MFPGHATLDRQSQKAAGWHKDEGRFRLGQDLKHNNNTRSNEALNVGRADVHLQTFSDVALLKAFRLDRCSLLASVSTTPIHLNCI